MVPRHWVGIEPENALHGIGDLGRQLRRTVGRAKLSAIFGTLPIERDAECPGDIFGASCQAYRSTRLARFNHLQIASPCELSNLVEVITSCAECLGEVLAAHRLRERRLRQWPPRP